MADTNLIDIYIMGERHRVPDSLTILQAFEYAGYKLIRGVGCRGGFCGACATVYRLPGDYHLKFVLACQTRVEPDMQLTMVPFYPANRSTYRLSELKGEAKEVLDLYPEMLRCLGCNTCTKSCPQDIDVLGYVSAIVRGDLAAAADISFDCIMCGLCVSRCPAELVKHNAALLSRRIYGRKLAKKSAHLARRREEVTAGKFMADLAGLKKQSKDEMKKRYAERDIEKGE
ncbi:4Fe-4S dicluster domain-containing protein [candidate division WOR-3 bacterium]|nr:4Fe-4S dicluster domain-containing protein [candidate division WOR-3 bacterium]